MEVNLFKPFTKQKEILDNFLESDHLFGVISSPRGSGKTLLAENMLLYWLLSNPKQKGGWCSPIYNQAKKVFDEISEASRDLIVQSNRQDLNITFVNGSTLKLLSSDNPDTIRGFRFNYLIIDEFAYHKELAVTTALLPTLNPTGKKCLMVSTPRGKNFFYSWYTKGLDKKSDVISFKVPLTECPYINQSLVDEARKSLPPDVFKQEYLAEFTDASSDVFVGIDKVSILGVFDQSRREDAFIGIDTGLTSDMSVLTVISPTGRVLWIEALNNENITTIANKFINVMNAYNIVGGFIEVNGIGRAMADLVLPKYRKVKEFVTTQDSKTEAVRKLIADIESQTIELPTIELCPELHNELSSYTYKLSNNGKLSFSHPNGGNDDYVDSLLLANYSRVKFLDRRPLRIKGIKPRFQ